jgi:hypothetical protein
VTKINVNKVAKRMESSEWVNNTEAWLDAKHIDDGSLDKYLDELSMQGLKMVMGELTVTNDRAAAAREIYNLIGTAFQLGYTTCEAQMERDYLSEDKEDG